MAFPSLARSAPIVDRWVDRLGYWGFWPVMTTVWTFLNSKLVWLESYGWAEWIALGVVFSLVTGLAIATTLALYRQFKPSHHLDKKDDAVSSRLWVQSSEDMTRAVEFHANFKLKNSHKEVKLYCKVGKFLSFANGRRWAWSNTEKTFSETNTASGHDINLCVARKNIEEAVINFGEGLKKQFEFSRQGNIAIKYTIVFDGLEITKYFHAYIFLKDDSFRGTYLRTDPEWLMRQDGWAD